MVKKVLQNISWVSVGWLGVAWIFLAGGSWQSWLLGVPGIILGLLAGAALSPVPSFKLSLTGLGAFLIFFLINSFIGGVDVSLRALDPKLPLSPCTISYQSRLSNEWALVLFVNTISLLPGTLSMELTKKHILVHRINETYPIIEKLSLLESKIAAMFGEEWNE